MDGLYAFWREVHYRNLMVQTVQCAFTVQPVPSNFHKITYSENYIAVSNKTKIWHVQFIYQCILTQQLFPLLIAIITATLGVTGKSLSEAVNDRKYVFHFRPKPKPKLEKHLALGRIPKPKVQIYVKIGGILLKFIVSNDLSN